MLQGDWVPWFAWSRHADDCVTPCSFVGSPALAALHHCSHHPRTCCPPRSTGRCDFEGTGEKGIEKIQQLGLSVKRQQPSTARRTRTRAICECCVGAPAGLPCPLTG